MHTHAQSKILGKDIDLVVSVNWCSVACFKNGFDASLPFSSLVTYVVSEYFNYDFAIETALILILIKMYV